MIGSDGFRHLKSGHMGHLKINHRQIKGFASIPVVGKDAHHLRAVLNRNNMHVPFGIMAVLSDDNGQTWDKLHPVFLARAWGPAGGWSSSVQLDDGSIVTAYSIQAYRNEGLDTVVETVRWQAPDKKQDPRTVAGITTRVELKMEPHDRSKYPAQLYGYSGVNRQQVAYLALRPAVPVRPRGGG